MELRGMRTKIVAGKGAHRTALTSQSVPCLENSQLAFRA